MRKDKGKGRKLPTLPKKGEDLSPFLKQLSRRELKALYERLGTDLFYSRDSKRMFTPAYLSAYFQVLYKVVTLYNHHGKTVERYRYDWDNLVYRPDGDRFLTEEIKRMWGRKFNQRLVTPTLYDLTADTGLPIEEFVLDPKYIPVRNGTIVLEESSKGKWSFTFQKSDPSRYVVNRLPVDYVKGAFCPQIQKFFTSILPGQVLDISILRRWIGYTLYRDMPFALALLLLGERDNGKSTLIDLITKFLGPENTVQIPVADLCNRPWFLAELYKKLANLDADIGTKDLKEAGRFKRAIGGDRLMAEKKYIHPFYFKPYCKHIWSCNRIPYSYDESEGFYKRWHVIMFNQTFSPEDPRTDPYLSEKLTTDEELSGFLNWALGGLIKLLNEGGFIDLPSAVIRRAQWTRHSNPVNAFVYSKEVVLDPRGTYPVKQFFEDFRAWCSREGLPAWTKDRVGRALPKNFPEIYQIRPREGPPVDRSAPRPRVWKGLRPPHLRETDEKQSELFFRI